MRCGWSHVPVGACGDYTACLHEAQPEIKLLAFPIMATAPWRHEGLPVWQISQCLVRIRHSRVSIGSLPCRCFKAIPFPSHPGRVRWRLVLHRFQVWRSEAVQEDMLSYSSAGVELTAGLGSGEVQWPRQ